MKRFLYFSKKILPWITAITAVMVVSTVMLYRSLAELPQERLIFFFYQTNVPAGNASQWAQQLKENNPEIEYSEAQCYTAHEGYGPSGLQSGWTYITARLAKKEGDVLILPESQYKLMADNNWLMPLNGSLFGSFNGLMQNEKGEILGLTVSSMSFEGLEFPCAQEPHNVISALNGERLIICVYHQTADPALTQKILYKIMSGAGWYGGSNE